MEGLKIWLLSILAAIMYGILHDQVTARICVEYFSIAHPTILPLTSPTLLALQWGILATWWVGCCLGIGLAVSARLGLGPPLSARDLYRPLAILLLCMALGSLVAGITEFLLARAGLISLNGRLATAIPAPKHARFMADWWAHAAAYVIGFLGGLTLCVRTFVTRRRVAASAL